MAAEIKALLHGGLGNQLFVFAAALQQARRLDVNFELLIPRQLAHGGFQLRDLLTQEERYVRCRNLRKLSVTPLELRLAKKSDIYANFRKIYCESQFNFDEQIDNIHSGTFIFGYFQSERYFNRVTEELRNRFQIIDHFPPEFTYFKDRIQTHSNNIGVHIRRGDYLKQTVANFHGLLGDSYFRRGIQILREAGFDGKLFVFSDSPNLASEIMQGEEFELVKDYQKASPIEQLRLFATCDAKILSNSSFSWWGAWLGENQANVIAPNRWFASGAIDTSDLPHAEWKLLD